MSIKKKAALMTALAWIMLLPFPFMPGVQSVNAEVIWEIQEDAKAVWLTVECNDLFRDARDKLTDGDFRSFCIAEKNLHLAFSASEPIKGIYFIFEKPCQWTLSLPDGTVRPGGKNGFIHEYVALDQEITAFEMDIPVKSVLTDVYAFTGGRLPDWVQVWQPPCDRADLMLMPTHADDEHLWFGGAMPYYAGELGYKVQVVYLTNHYNATHRGHELLNGLWTVGVRNYPVITDKFLDEVRTKRSEESAAEYFGRDRVKEFQVEMLRRFAPRVIIAHDINGEYGHGAHKLNASTLLEALKIYEDPSVYPESAEKYGITKVQKCYLHLWPENRITVQWSDKKLTRFNGRSALEMAEEGFHCHRSQLRYSFAVREYDKYDCRQFGLAYTTVGYDTPGLNDMFEHVDMSDGEKPQDEEIVEKDPVGSVSDAETAVSDSDSYFLFYGRKVLKSDILLALTAMAFSLAGLVAVICLKRPK